MEVINNLGFENLHQFKLNHCPLLCLVAMLLALLKPEVVKQWHFIASFRHIKDQRPLQSMKVQWLW